MKAVRNDAKTLMILAYLILLGTHAQPTINLIYLRRQKPTLPVTI